MITTSAIAQYRLSNQHISNNTLDTPADVVSNMGMVQAQDFLGALWAVGLRMKDATQTGVEKALADRSIVRMWSARGTLHFVAAQDVRWILELLAPRVILGNAGRYKQLDLDEATFARSKKLFINVLQGGNQLSREAMFQVLELAHISTVGQRGIHILQRVALEGMICFGTRIDKQHTFVLLEEWVPQAKTMTHDQALAELAQRYFSSHGPATLKDYIWWSGLTTADARAGLEMAEPYLAQETLEGQTYWQPRSPTGNIDASPMAYLLPAFDEYLVGYTDRSAILHPRYVLHTNAGGGMLNPTIVIDGQVMGTWKRTLKKGSVVIVPSWFTEVTDAQKHAFTLAAIRYGAFLDLPVVLAEL